jgi:hypothetical protein
MEARHAVTCGLQGLARPWLVPLAEHRPNVRADLALAQNRRYTVKATWQSGETKTLGFVREGRAEAYAAHAHRFGAAVTLTDTETGVVLLEMSGPFPVGLPPERPQQRLESFKWGGPMGGVKRDVFTAGANDFAAEWVDTDGNRRLGGFVRFTGTQPGNETLAQVLALGNDANALRIVNLADPVNAQDAVTKNYADSHGGRTWSVLTDGVVAAPQLVFAGGDVIMVVS